MNETIVGYRELTDEPGRLQGDVSLIVHTRHALTLARGRKLNLPKGKEMKGKNPRIPGLIDFGRQMRVICMAAEADDPLADWTLIRVEESMGRARVGIAERLERVMKVLSARPSVHVTLAQSEAPVKIRLAFGTPYTYQATYILEDFDRLCTAVLTATHVALLRKTDGSQLIESCASMIRGLLTLPFNWSARALTRTDVLQNNQRAIQAMRLLAEVPEDVMQGTRRAEFAPDIRVKGSGFLTDGQEAVAAIMAEEDAMAEDASGAESGELEQQASNVVVVKHTRRRVVKSTSVPLKGL